MMKVEESDYIVDTELPVLNNLTYRETHAFVDGLYCGYNNIHETEYSQEKHYWRVGWLIGELVLTTYETD